MMMQHAWNRWLVASALGVALSAGTATVQAQETPPITFETKKLSGVLMRGSSPIGLVGKPTIKFEVSAENLVNPYSLGAWNIPTPCGVAWVAWDRFYLQVRVHYAGESGWYSRDRVAGLSDVSCQDGNGVDAERVRWIAAAKFFELWRAADAKSFVPGIVREQRVNAPAVACLRQGLDHVREALGEVDTGSAAIRKLTKRKVDVRVLSFGPGYLERVANTSIPLVRAPRDAGKDEPLLVRVISYPAGDETPCELPSVQDVQRAVANFEKVYADYEAIKTPR